METTTEVEELIFLGHIMCIFEDEETGVLSFYCGRCSRYQIVSRQTWESVTAGQEWLCKVIAEEHYRVVMANAVGGLSA